MADYETEFLSIYINKEIKDIQQEIVLINVLFGETEDNMLFTDLTSAFNMLKELNDSITFGYAQSMSEDDLLDLNRAFTRPFIQILKTENNAISDIFEYYHALFTGSNRQQYADDVPDSALNKITESNGLTHINLAVSRKHNASEIMDNTQKLMIALFDTNIKQLKRLKIEESDSFDASKAVKII